MSYAIIRNAKYKRENLKGNFRHNERRNKNYSNKNIDKEKQSILQQRATLEQKCIKLKENYNKQTQLKISIISKSKSYKIILIKNMIVY